jgi:polyhydroxyalkanoate synthase subunit PhaC
MNDQQDNDAPEKNMAESVSDIAERSQRLVSEFLSRQASKEGLENTDPLNMGATFIEMTSRMMADPAKLMETQAALWQDYMALWQSTASRMMGQDTAPVIAPEKGDYRFKHDAWTENEVFSFIKQSYLLASRSIQSSVRDSHDESNEGKKDARKMDFAARQFVNAMSPSNFVMTNPEVLEETIETGGENLVNGLQNMLEDLERGNGNLRIKMTDMDAFTVGENVAGTPGKVIFRNDLLELLQYAPSTDKVCQPPLFIITPWINKYYILDLRPDNSLIKWAVDQGHTVFITSWVNPDERLADKGFDDYMQEGILDSLDAIQKATGEKSINAIGYCIGGTLLATTLAYMAATNDKRISTATFFTTMVDFQDPGELGVFIDEEQLASLEQKMAQRGYLDGAEMANTFNMMRDNDLIWYFVVNNYLMGKDPFPFDLLYWNADSTRMPAAMHSFYLRKMYLENKLIEPGGISFKGVPIDLRKIDLPTYIVSTKEDHIAPWKSTYAACNIYQGQIRFVLAASGHIAGVVNPPAAEKYSHWTNTKTPKDPEAWLESATKHKGSWWPDWGKWVKQKSPKKPVTARVPGDGKLKPLEDAPGSYIKVRADDD